MLRLLKDSLFYLVDFDVAPASLKRAGASFDAVNLQADKTTGVGAVALGRNDSRNDFLTINPSGNFIADGQDAEVIPFIDFKVLVKIAAIYRRAPAFPCLAINVSRVVSVTVSSRYFNLRTINSPEILLAFGGCCLGANLYSGIEGGVYNFSFKLQLKVSKLFI